MRVKFAISLIIIINIMLPVSSTAQCDYGYLIDSNLNHPNGIWCWPPNSTICYSYNTINEPLSDAKDVIDDAACEWSIVCGYSIKEDIICGNGNIIWINDKEAWERVASDSAAAVTQTNCTENKMYLNGFTIYLNCATFQPCASCSWTSSCETNKIDLKSVMLHEFGHVLGLLDTDFCTQSVMYGSITRGECRSLYDIDKQAVQYLCDNAASRIISFTPILKQGGVEINWECINYNSTRFYLESRQPWEKEFKHVNSSINITQMNRYRCFDSEGTKETVYRLVEMGKAGNILVHAQEKPIHENKNVRPDKRFILHDERGDLSKWAKLSKAKINVGLRNEEVTEDWVAIGPQDYVCSDGILALAYWHEQIDGFTTAVTNLQCIRDFWNDDIYSYIQYLYNHGTQYIVLVGDANDHELWDDGSVWSVNGWDSIKPDYISQPEYDIISADYYLDLDPPDASMSYFTPYYASDLPKSDVDGDGYPEIVVGRIPVHSVDDVLSYCAKAVKYLQNPDGDWTDDISLWVDARFMAGNDGNVAESLGMDLRNYMPSDYNVHILKNNPCPDCIDDYSTRESMAINEFDSGRALIVSFGTVANCYRLNDWLDARPDYGFDISKLSPNNIFPFLLAISCELGAFDETESPTSGKPLCERLLFDDSRGVIGIFAPTRGSWQGGNYQIGKLVLKYLYDKGAQSLGHACMAAQRDLMWYYPKYKKFAQSYVYLGDPAIFLSGAVRGEITTVEENIIKTPDLSIETNYPNPFNPMTTIEYSLSQASYIELSIYNVKGELIKRLVSGVEVAGTYKAVWNGRDERGRSVASGVYFCILRSSDGNKITRKIILLR